MKTTSDGEGEPLVWTDAHNHLQDPRLDGCRADWPECIVNSIQESDWDAVLATAKAPKRHAALGIHPWFADTATPGWEQRLHQLLIEYPTAGIGECGLDTKTKRCEIELQLPIFKQQLELARELDRLMTIHCIAAWERMIDVFNHTPPPTRWLLHGFNGSGETARRFTSMGAYFSISARVISPGGEKILRAFREIPRERILLETDAPNLPLDPPAAGIEIAQILGCNPREFATSTRQNLHQFLKTSPAS